MFADRILVIVSNNTVLVIHGLCSLGNVLFCFQESAIGAFSLAVPACLVLSCSLEF